VDGACGKTGFLAAQEETPGGQPILVFINMNSKFVTQPPAKLGLLNHSACANFSQQSAESQGFKGKQTI
jgi:hypothetical protein